MNQTFQDYSNQEFVDLAAFPGTKQGAHEALTDVELITIRLGAMGEFEGV